MRRVAPRPTGKPITAKKRRGGMTMMLDGVEHTIACPAPPGIRVGSGSRRGVPDFDRLFLTFMMQHHRGAVSR